MSVTVKLVGFLVALAVVFGGAVGIGRAVGPVDSSPDADHGDMEGMDGMEGMDMPEPGAIPKGLMVSQNGYSFRLDQATVAPGSAVPVSFTIEGPDGSPVTEYDLEHEKELHLIAVRRDFSGFQHVHPVRADDGTWSVPLELTAGQWRLFADFKAADAEALTLGTDLAVDGDYRPATPGDESRTAKVDGYTVTLDGQLTPGADSKLTLDVSRDGKPVTDLQPYLGAYGHLVALRAGDLAYLHVHPDGTPEDGKTKPGPEVVFYAAVPSNGTYHLYLDFKHDGVVRTAAFTVSANETAGSPTASPESGSSDNHSGH